MKKNNYIRPYITWVEISGKSKKIVLEKAKFIIGRLADQNDLSLWPDHQKLVTRYMHCSIEMKNTIPFIVDNASKNGTFLKRNNQVQQVKGAVKLENEDVILILKKIGADQPPEYWEIVFIDPLATGTIAKITPSIYYDWVQAKLFLNEGENSTEINHLTPLEHKLIRYMDQRNKSNNNVPVMCTYSELISAIWENSFDRTNNDVNHIIAALRKKIEVNYKKPCFLLNIRGMGYRLVSNL